MYWIHLDNNQQKRYKTISQEYIQNYSDFILSFIFERGHWPDSRQQTRNIDEDLQLTIMDRDLV